jgi:hypothetical protein
MGPFTGLAVFVSPVVVAFWLQEEETIMSSSGTAQQGKKRGNCAAMSSFIGEAILFIM